MEPDELLTAVDFPTAAERSGGAFHELARRHGDYAQAGVAARLELDAEDRCTFARLVYLSVGDTPISAQRASALLRDEGVSDATIDAAADLASRTEIDPSGDIHASPEYKRHIAQVLTRRALHQAWQRARGEAV